MQYKILNNRMVVFKLPLHIKLPLHTKIEISNVKVSNNTIYFNTNLTCFSSARFKPAFREDTSRDERHGGQLLYP